MTSERRALQRELTRRPIPDRAAQTCPTRLAERLAPFCELPGDERFTGREVELAALDEALAAVLEGRPRRHRSGEDRPDGGPDRRRERRIGDAPTLTGLLLTGGSGLGKAAIVREWARRLLSGRRAGALRILDLAAGRCRAGLAEALGLALADPDAGSADTDPRSTLFQDGVLDQLFEAACGRPTVLLVPGLDRRPVADRRFLARLLRSLQGRRTKDHRQGSERTPRVFIVATCRRARGPGPRRPGLERLEVHPLSRDDARALARRIGFVEPGPRLLDLLSRKPGYVVRLARGVSGRELERRLAVMTPVEVARLTLPDDQRRLLGLLSLFDGAVPVTAPAALMGLELDDETCETYADTLAEAAVAGDIALGRDADGRLVVEARRRHLALELKPEVRRDGALCARLEALVPTFMEDLEAELWLIQTLGGRRETGRALALTASLIARDRPDRALRLLASLPQSSARRRLEARALLALGRHLEARPRLAAELKDAKASADEPREIEVLGLLATLNTELREFEEARRCFMQTLVAGRRRGCEPTILRSLLGLGRLTLRAGRAAEAIESFEQGLAMPGLEPRRRLELRLGLARAARLADLHERLAETLELALADAESARDLPGLADVRALRAGAALRAGDEEAAEQELRELRRISRLLGDIPRQAEARTLQAELHVVRGEPGLALRELEGAIEAARREGDDSRLSRGLLLKGLIHMEAGRPAAARPRLEEATTRANRAGDHHGYALALNRLGHARLWCGDSAAAKAAFGAARRAARRAGLEELEFLAAVGLARVAEEERRPEAGIEALEGHLGRANAETRETLALAGSAGLLALAGRRRDSRRLDRIIELREGGAELNSDPRVLIQRLRGALQREEGRLARRLLESLAGRREGVPAGADVLALLIRIHRAELAILEGRPDDAIASLDQLVETGRSRGFELLVRRSLRLRLEAELARLRSLAASTGVDAPMTRHLAARVRPIIESATATLRGSHASCESSSDDGAPGDPREQDLSLVEVQLALDSGRADEALTRLARLGRGLPDRDLESRRAVLEGEVAEALELNDAKVFGALEAVLRDEQARPSLRLRAARLQLDRRRRSGRPGALKAPSTRARALLESLRDDQAEDSRAAFAHRGEVAALRRSLEAVRHQPRAEEPRELERLRDHLASLTRERDELLARVDRLQQRLDAARVDRFVSAAPAAGTEADESDSASLPMVRPGVFERVVATSPAMQELVRLARRAVRRADRVALIGERGTGRAFLARVLHDASPVADGPFIAIDAAAVRGEALSVALFGLSGDGGALRRARAGTLFLGNLDQASTDVQARLAMRLGQGRDLPRIITSLGPDPDAAIADGCWREDLDFALRVVALTVPALRDRREDLPALARLLAERLPGRGSPELTTDERRRLARSEWRGNLPELRNALALGGEDPAPDAQTASESPAPSRDAPEALGALAAIEAPEDLPDLKDTLAGVERAFLAKALELHDGNKTHTAKALGLSRYGLLKKLDRHGLRDES